MNTKLRSMGFFQFEDSTTIENSHEIGKQTLQSIILMTGGAKPKLFPWKLADNRQ